MEVEKHGKQLYETIRERATEKQVFYVYGGVEADEREKIREITEKSDNAIIVASYGTFSTGINIRNLHNIIFASPSKSRIRNLQSIGRGLRLKDNNSAATLYDIADYTIWMDTIKEGRFEDTNKMFEAPNKYDFRVGHMEANMWAFLIKQDILDTHGNLGPHSK